MHWYPDADDDRPPPTPSKPPTARQRIKELEAQLAAASVMTSELHHDCYQAAEAARTMEWRAIAAEEVAAVMLERARALWEAVSNGKITTPEAILRELERIIHA
jgi:hypothetical protein